MADGDVAHESVRLDGEPLDPPAPFTLMLNKPAGYTCSMQDAGALIYDLLPPRFRRRSPTLASIGRLDRDTTGLLLMTDDGALLHRIVHPKAHLPKVYEATLARDLAGNEAEIFASGTLMLNSETTPLAPASLEVLGPGRARLTLTEGRYQPGPPHVRGDGATTLRPCIAAGWAAWISATCRRASGAHCRPRT